MGLPGNLTLVVVGALAEGVACYVGIRLVAPLARRLTKPPPPKPRALTGELIPRRSELPAPPRKELPR